MSQRASRFASKGEELEMVESSGTYKDDDEHDEEGSDDEEPFALESHDQMSYRTKGTSSNPHSGDRKRKQIVLLLFGVTVIGMLWFGRTSRTAEVRMELATVAVVANGRTFQVTERAQAQIDSFRGGTGLVVNVHITHHAGTFICNAFKHGAIANTGTPLSAPEFACRTDVRQKTLTSSLRPVVLSKTFPPHDPWTHDETASNIETMRSYWHMIAWEYDTAPRPALAETNWDDPNLVSIIIMRHPLDRLLAGDHLIATKYTGLNGGPDNVPIEMWWDYAKTPHNNTNNFALKVLAGSSCCQGKDTDPIHLEHAKELLSRFTFILDIDCLDDGMMALGDLLGLQFTLSTKLHREHDKREDRFPPEIYQYLLERNRLDIQLYEWSRERSLIKCNYTD